MVWQSWTGDHSPQPGQRSSGTVELGLRRYGDLELRGRSIESFVVKLKPRDVLAVGAEQPHQQIGLLHIASGERVPSPATR